MDNDQRDRREWPAQDSDVEGRIPPDEVAADASRPDAEPPTGADEPADSTPYAEPAPVEPSPSAAEIESWPSQETASTDAAAWPTEPPTAASGGADTWPTAAPERGSEPAPSEPARDESEWHSATTQPVTDERPPSEVEAYPAPVGADVATGAAMAGAANTVPDAESSTGESTQCPRCGTENRPGLAFCRNCGQRLVAAGVATTVERPGAPEGTMACPRCGTHNRAGVAFCQNCGANLRGTAPGYVPPAVAADPEVEVVERERRGAILGPVVLLIGLIGLVTGYLLPFLYGTGSLFERATGSDGYGVAFWNGYPDVAGTLADQAYFGLAAPVPLLALLLLVLAVAGFARVVPGALQTVGLGIALLWSVGLIILFVVVELAGNWGGDLVGVLRELSPAGIIFFLSSLIVLIGTLTRFGRS